MGYNLLVNMLFLPQWQDGFSLCCQCNDGKGEPSSPSRGEIEEGRKSLHPGLFSASLAESPVYTLPIDQNKHRHNDRHF